MEKTRRQAAVTAASTGSRSKPEIRAALRSQLLWELVMWVFFFVLFLAHSMELCSFAVNSASSCFAVVMRRLAAGVQALVVWGRASSWAVSFRHCCAHETNES